MASLGKNPGGPGIAPVEPRPLATSDSGAWRVKRMASGAQLG